MRTPRSVWVNVDERVANMSTAAAPRNNNDEPGLHGRFLAASPAPRHGDQTDLVDGVSLSENIRVRGFV